MGIRYEIGAGFGIMFTGDEIKQFVKDHNIRTDYDDDIWECAEAVGREYNLNYAYAGEGITEDDMYFLFGSVRMLNEYDNDRFKFHKINIASVDEAAAILKLRNDSGKKSASYIGVYVG